MYQYDFKLISLLMPTCTSVYMKLNHPDRSEFIPVSCNQGLNLWRCSGVAVKACFWFRLLPDFLFDKLVKRMYEQVCNFAESAEKG